MTASNGISSRTAPAAVPARSEASSCSIAERFALQGPSLILDERVHAFRRDIADIALAGQIFAPHYSRPLMRRGGARPTFVRPDRGDGAPSTELLPGEEFAVLEVSGQTSWGYCRHDHYVGYVETAALVDDFRPSHVVAAASAPLHSEPDPASPVLASLPMGARIAGHEGPGFLATASGFVPLAHLHPLAAFEDDPAAIAERLLGAPYLLGGRTWRGIDCSGLVQLALGLCGIPAPRDSDQQRALGVRLSEDEALQRSDLIYFEGHVGMMLDAERMIHATAFAGKVVVEPLVTVAARKPVIERRRIRT